MAWDSSLLVEEESKFDPSLLFEEEPDRSAKREKLKAEMVEARKVPLSQRVSDTALAIAEPVVDTISKMNPLTVIPRAAYGAGKMIGVIPEDEPFPLEQDTPLVDLQKVLVNPVVEAGNTLDELRYGAQQAVADVGQFFFTPAGISTLGAGAAPKAAQAALAAGFAGSMAAAVPEAREASRQAAESGSMADTARAVLNEFVTTAAPVGIGLGALRQGLKPAGSLIAETPRQVTERAPVEVPVTESAPAPVEVSLAKDKTSDAVFSKDSYGDALIAAKKNKKEYRPAVQNKSGEIFEGATHEEAISVADGDFSKRGFATPDGKFLTLMEVAEREIAKKQPAPATVPPKTAVFNGIQMAGPSFKYFNEKTGRWNDVSAETARQRGIEIPPEELAKAGAAQKPGAAPEPAVQRSSIEKLNAQIKEAVASGQGAEAARLFKLRQKIFRLGPEPSGPSSQALGIVPPELAKAEAAQKPPEQNAAVIEQKASPVVQNTVSGVQNTPTPVSIGPGAASPTEFAQRSKPVTIEEAPKVFREPPRSEPPGSAPISSPSPNIEVVRSNKDYNLFNNINSSQWAFYFGKLGESAKSAIERIFTGEFRMRESINKDTRVYVERTLDSLPRQLKKQGGKAFFDVVNGKRMEDIRSEWESKPGGDKVIVATEQLKTRLEEVRTTIRDTKRESYNSYLNSLDEAALGDLFTKNMGEGADASRFTKAQKADALTLSSLPDDWGIADGTYLPHLFFGGYKVTAGEGAFVTRAKTLAEAKAKIYQLTKNNPELASSAFKVEQDTVVPADMIRLGDKNFWRMVANMKESLGVSAAEVKEAQAGIIGRKASKQKWFGSLQERQGFEGYSKDFKQVMTAYLNGFHRWKELSAMQRDVQPMIEKVRSEGRPNAANRLDEIMENLWGKPAKSTVEFDAFVRQIPGVRDWIKPLALDRWSRNVRSLVSLLTLTTVRRAVVNRLQPLQGLYPLVGERLFAKGKILQHTAEGKALLEEGGVRFDTGQYSEPGAKTKLSEFQEKISGEIGNQEQAFLSMFLHGQEQGMGRAEAIQYAKLRGQLMTQFTPLISDIPKALSGPFGQLAFQFKRFPIKQAELAAQMVRERNFGGITRMLGVFAVMGGASFYMRQLMLDKEKQLRMRRALEAELGKKGADVAMYGLPGLVGADLSGSLVLGDEPFGDNIYEKAGRQVAGPALTLAYETGKNIFKAARKPMTGMEKTKAIIRRIPSLKPLAELADLESGNTDVMTPDGEVKYRRALSDAIVGLGSFRSANEANKQLTINAIIELKKETQGLKNDVFMSLNSDPAKAIDAVKAFNARWPEAAITADELTGYLKRRRTSSVKTDEERTAGKKFRPLIGN